MNAPPPTDDLENDLNPDFMEIVQTKSNKHNKIQSEDDFIIQKNEYKNGPVIQSDDWLFNKQLYDCSSKVGRGYLKNAAERAYYLEDYNKVIEILDIAKDWNLGEKDRKELEVIREHAEKKMGHGRS